MTVLLDHAGPYLSRYDVLFCDVWGVVHDGVRAHAEAVDALMRFRMGGGTVILVSNVPTTHDYVQPFLKRMGVGRDVYDRLVTSGDLTRWRLRTGGERAIHHIGTDRDRQLFDGLDVALTGLDDAQIVVATELVDDRTESADDYRPLLAQARARDLPFICGNPDLVVHVGDALLPCAGALATIYAEMGGNVFWCGKPHRPTYERALALAVEVRGTVPELSRILGIGDALRTDIAGARGFGIDALLIASGIHRGTILDGDGHIDAAALAEVARTHGVAPHTAMDMLRW